MRRPEAMKRAHTIVALLIQQALDSSPDDWSGDLVEHELINDCVIEIQKRHERSGNTGSKPTGSEGGAS